MATEKIKSFEVKFDVFGRPVLEHSLKKSDSSLRTRDEITVKLLEDGSTKPIVSGKIDIVDEIQTFKGDAGFEGMRKILRAGQAVPGDFADDGKHSGEDAPTMLAAAANAVPSAARLKALENEVAALQAKIAEAKTDNQGELNNEQSK